MGVPWQWARFPTTLALIFFALTVPADGIETWGICAGFKAASKPGTKKSLAPQKLAVKLEFCPQEDGDRSCCTIGQDAAIRDAFEGTVKVGEACYHFLKDRTQTLRLKQFFCLPCQADQPHFISNGTGPVTLRICESFAQSVWDEMRDHEDPDSRPGQKYDTCGLNFPKPIQEFTEGNVTVERAIKLGGPRDDSADNLQPSMWFDTSSEFLSAPGIMPKLLEDFGVTNVEIIKKGDGRECFGGHDLSSAAAASRCGSKMASTLFVVAVLTVALSTLL